MQSSLPLKPLATLSLFFILLFASQAQSAVPADFTELVKATGPAVVNISTERIEEVRPFPGFGGGFFPGNPRFDRFFEQFDNYPRPDKRSRKRSSLGSGFIISADGYIVTNNHVVEGADVIRVAMGEKKEDSYTAEVIGTDPDTDLALLKIDAKNLPSLTFGDSEALLVGEWVLAIGNPLGLDHTVTAGIVSAKGRNIQSGSYDDFLQTDASINPGNSGGPLLNMQGKVIGINTAIAQRAQGIGFAIPSNLAQKVITDLKDHRKVSRGWLGVTIQDVSEATAKALGMKKNAGALIGSVMKDEPADRAGVKAGDVILSLNGQSVDDADALLRRVAMLAPNSTATLVVWRDGKEMTLSVTVSERGRQQNLTSDKGQPKDTPSANLGITVRALTPNDQQRLKLENTQGLLVTAVTSNGLCATAGIQTNDVIVAVNRVQVSSTQEFVDAVNESAKTKGALLLHIARGGNLFFVPIDMADTDQKKK